MGLYTNFYTESTTDYLSNVRLAQFSESDSIVESGYMSIVECEHEWNNIMRSIALEELAVLESTGEEVVYESGGIKGFFEAIANFFKKIWAAIAGLIAKFLDWLNVEGRKNANFVKKYKDKIKKVKIPADADITMDNYSFAGLERGVDYDGLFKQYEKFKETTEGFDLLRKPISGASNISSLEDYIIKNRNLYNDKMNILRKSFCPKVNGVDEKTFPTKFKEYLMGKKEEKLDPKSIVPSELIDYIKDAKDAKDKVKKAYNDLKKNINDTIKNVKRMESELLKDAKEKEKDMDKEAKKSSTLKMNIADVLIKQMKGTATIAQKANTIQLSVMSSKVKQCKKIATYIVSNYTDTSSDDKDDKDEKATSESYQFESAFGLDLL